MLVSNLNEEVRVVWSFLSAVLSPVALLNIIYLSLLYIV